MDSFAELDSVFSLITKSAEQVKTGFTKLGLPFPNLDDLEPHALDTAHVPAELQYAIRCIQGACTQLSTLVTTPQQALTIVSCYRLRKRLCLSHIDTFR